MGNDHFCVKINHVGGRESLSCIKVGNMEELEPALGWSHNLFASIAEMETLLELQN